VFNSQSFVTKKTSVIVLNNYANKIIKICEKERFHPACYDREIPKLMKKISMEDAFRVTSIIQFKDSSYPFCHVLAHNLAGIEVDKDPSKWKDVAVRAPSSMCSNGGLHGAFQQRFRAENVTPKELEKLKPELISLCEKRAGWNPTSLERGACYHALGHLTMYLTKADEKASLDLCDVVAIKPDGQNLSQTCYDGVFMQIFQPLEAEDFALVKGKDLRESNLKNFCGRFKGSRRASCWGEAWPQVREKVLTPNGLQKYCSDDFLKDSASKEKCYMDIFYMIVVNRKFDMSSYNDFCSELPESVSGMCVKAGATRLITTDYNYIYKAVEFCSKAKRIQDEQTCYNELVRYSLYTFPTGSKESISLCNALPTEWRNKCSVKNNLPNK
jgi:hypothetical protein